MHIFFFHNCKMGKCIMGKSRFSDENGIKKIFFSRSAQTFLGRGVKSG